MMTTIFAKKRNEEAIAELIPHSANAAAADADLRLGEAVPQIRPVIPGSLLSSVS